MVYDKFRSGFDKIISTLKIYPNSWILLGCLMTFLGLIKLIYVGIREKCEVLILIRVWLAVLVVSWGLWNIWNLNIQRVQKIPKEEKVKRKSLIYRTQTVVTTSQKKLYKRSPSWYGYRKYGRIELSLWYQRNG